MFSAGNRLISTFTAMPPAASGTVVDSLAHAVPEGDEGETVSGEDFHASPYVDEFIPSGYVRPNSTDNVAAERASKTDGSIEPWLSRTVRDFGNPAVLYSNPFEAIIGGIAKLLGFVRYGVADLTHRIGFWLWPTVHMPEKDDLCDDYVYHGTSFKMLKDMVAGGGNMRKILSYYSSETGFPLAYAQFSARKTGTDGFILRFERNKVIGKLTEGHNQPTFPTGHGRSVRVAEFLMAAEDVPLADMTTASKRNILEWMAEKRDKDPQDDSWPRLIADFELVLGAKAPPVITVRTSAAQALDVFRKLGVDDRLIQEVMDHYHMSPNGVHGPMHWARVLENGLALAKQTGASTDVITYFALLHDCQRNSNYSDPLHGPRAAEFAQTVRPLIHLDDAGFADLVTAMQHHTNDILHANPTIETSWDADRLDLPRVRVKIDPGRLSTDAARSPEMIRWATLHARDKALYEGPDATSLLPMR